MSDEPAARVRKERPRASAVKEPLGYEYAEQHYLPSCLAAQFESPLLVLRFFFDTQDTTAKAAAEIASVLRTSGSSKKGSLRRQTSALDVNEANALDEQQAALAVADEARDVTKRLTDTIDTFMRLVVALTGLTDKQQIFETLSFAEYLLLDDSVIDHPRLRRRRLASNGLIVANGRMHVQKLINAQAWQEGYGVVEAKRRTQTVFDQANKWLADVCKGVCDLFDVLPVVWTLDYKLNEKLSNAALGERTVQASLDLPFLMIGMFDALRLNEPRDALARSLLRRLI